MSEFETILAMLATLERGQVSLRADIIGKLEKIENELTAIRDDIGVNMGRADAVERSNENIRADVRSMQEQMTVHWRQIKRLETNVRELKGGKE